MARPNPLANSRFRAALLIGAGVPIAALYLWRTVAQPLLLGTVPGDFGENYLAAATRIAAGQDPYDVCAITTCPGAAAHAFSPLPLAGAQYVTPLPVAWKKASRLRRPSCKARSQSWPSTR